MKMGGVSRCVLLAPKGKQLVHKISLVPSTLNSVILMNLKKSLKVSSLPEEAVNNVQRSIIAFLLSFFPASDIQWGEGSE